MSFEIPGADKDFVIMSESLTERMGVDHLSETEIKEKTENRHECIIQFETGMLKGFLVGIENIETDQQTVFQFETFEDPVSYLLSNSITGIKIFNFDNTIMHESEFSQEILDLSAHLGNNGRNTLTLTLSRAENK